MIIFSSLTIPNKNIWLLTKIGKNSLYIYLFHRIITIIIDKELFTQSKYSNNIILYSLLFSLLIIIIFGSDFFAKIINNFINMIYDYLFEMNIKGKICGFIFSIFFISILLLWRNDLLEAEKQKELELIKKSELSIKLINNYDFNKYIRISYVGDLILLKDQVISAKNISNGKYEFDEMFKYPVLQQIIPIIFLFS